MKKVVLFWLFLFFSFSFSVSAEEEDFYTIYESTPKEKSYFEVEKNTEDKNISKSLIKEELEIMQNDITISKNQMYNEIRNFKYSF